MDCFFRKTASYGKSYRDTACVSVGNLLVIVFLQTSKSGGIKFWKQLQNLHEGNQFGIGNQPKNLAWSLQSFEAIVVKAVKNQAIIFDSRLIHQSMMHNEHNRVIGNYQIRVEPTLPLHLKKDRECRHSFCLSFSSLMVRAAARSNTITSMQLP
jgi:hypothetical protein